MTEVAPPELPSLQRQILELTLAQHQLKRAIDLRRARIDEMARAEFARTGSAPSWKIRDLGTIRLDGADAPPKPEVNDAAAFASWIAERYPHEVTGTIKLDGTQLTAALEALDFAGVPHLGADLEVREAFQALFLKSLRVDRDDPDPENPDAPRPHFAILVDGDSGEVTTVPGVGAVQPGMKLYVSSDTAAKSDALAEVEAETKLVLDQLDEQTNSRPAIVAADTTEEA